MRGRCVAGLMLLTVWGGMAHAAEGRGDWAVAPFLGLHSPSLPVLDDKEFRSPFRGTADIIDDLGFNQPTPFEFRNNLDPMAPGALAGLEFQWRLNDRHSLLIGLGTWEAVSEATVQGKFPVQGGFERVVNSRKAKLSYNEFELGWRYDAVRRPKYRIYTRLSANNLFDVDYREDFSFLFLSGPPKSFRKSIIIQSQATGVLVLQAGVGGEWYVRDWFSVGFESGYGMGYRRFHLRDGHLTTDFRSTDNLFLEMPAIPGPNGNLEYRPEDGSGYRQMNLDFSGWKALFRVNFYY